MVELLALIDVCRRAGARRITGIIPYFGYGRADKRHGRHEPISASMVADLLQCVGVDHLLTVDSPLRVVGEVRARFDTRPATLGRPRKARAREYP